jgi:integrase
LRGKKSVLSIQTASLPNYALKNNRKKTGVAQAIPIVTPELQAVITELRGERKRIPNASGLLFTIDGQPIPKNLFEYWFRAACKKAGVKNFRFHDLRHCAISRWAAANVPTAVAMLASGHKSVASHKKYQNLQKAKLKSAFQNLSRNCPEEIEQEMEKSATA